MIPTTLEEIFVIYFSVSATKGFIHLQTIKFKIKHVTSSWQSIHRIFCHLIDKNFLLMHDNIDFGTFHGFVFALSV